MKREGAELQAFSSAVMQSALYYLQITHSIPEIKSINCLMHYTYLEVKFCVMHCTSFVGFLTKHHLVMQ